ncbi:uncharacterized protein LOC135109592 [Scylla paramamosain]|uniref:uncharacterized protein LOC135109592 n=1 Tax=Scylla paramamosain TaxID=85552 RepID=UPI0030835DEA
MARDSSFVWLRPATEMENLLDCAARKGFYTTVVGLTVRSIVPLSDHHIKETLHHMFRKVPVLRMCFRRREETLWACDMNREELDFQVTDTQELVQAVETLMQYHFPTTEGPLWCTRLLPASDPGCSFRQELSATFPYTRTLLLANHHGIADGTSDMYIVNAFLNVLDDMLSDKAVDDAVQLGRIDAGEETKDIITTRMMELMEDEDQYQQLRENMKKSKQDEKLVPRAYPMPKDPAFKSQIVLRDLDKETTQSFISKCKEEQITLNSGLLAVFNTSLVDFVLEGGLEQDFYRIQELHAVNMRRYWSSNTSGALGAHRMMMKNVVSTPLNWKDHFWDYARSIHKNITKSLQEKYAVTCELLLLGGGNVEDIFAERSSPEYDYATSNMGNIDHIILSERHKVRLQHLFVVTSCFTEPMGHMFHTLRGRLIYSFVYANDVLTRDKAQKFVDKTFENLVTVLNM